MKKSILLFSLCSLLFSLNGAFGYTKDDVSNATYLADQGIIMKQSNTSNYRLDDTITRAEAVGIALKIKGVILPDNYFCKNYFSDVRYDANNNWKCRAIEIAADQGIISRSNKAFRPSDTITKVESLAIIFRALDTSIPSPSPGPGYISPFSDKDIVPWQFEILLYAAGIGVIDNPNIIPGSEGFQIIEDIHPFYYHPNQTATRAEMFRFGRNIIISEENIPKKIFTSSQYNFYFSYPTSWVIKEFPAHSSDFLPNDRTFFAIYPHGIPAQDFDGRLDVYSSLLGKVIDKNVYFTGKSYSEYVVNGVSWKMFQNKYGNRDYLTEFDGQTYHLSGTSEITARIIKSFQFLR